MISTLAQGFRPGDELAGIIDWYVSGKFYDLEFAHARAKEHVRKFATDHSGLATGLADYLAELRRQVRAFLRHADLELAARIRASWRGYLGHPRLAINILSDLIKRQRLRPSRYECLWFVVFDGMRWDTWQYTVRPRLLEQFEFTKPEKPYLSMLPSWTMVTRTSLLTGQPPQYWQQAPGRQSIDQATLAARAFGIQPNNETRELRFFSNMESDRKYEQLDPEDRYPWNILIFNISDDNLHKEKGSLSALNRTVSSQMDSIMQTLTLVVRPGDTLLVSSDHGFMELDDEDGIVIRNAERWQRQSAGGADPVRYRYLLGIKSDDGYAFDLPGFPTTEFTAAISQDWFKRSDDRRPPDRYAHGGLSLAEMVVPGAILQRIVEKKVEIVFTDLPAQIATREAEPVAFCFSVHNRGNQPGQFRIDVRCNTEVVGQSIFESLAPGATRTIAVRLAPPTAVRTGTPTFVELLFTHQNLQGIWIPARRTDIPLQIERRTDVVEIQFAGLDDLDEP